MENIRLSRAFFAIFLNQRETFRADVGKRERAHRRAAHARNVYG